MHGMPGLPATFDVCIRRHCMVKSCQSSPLFIHAFNNTDCVKAALGK